MFIQNIKSPKFEDFDPWPGQIPVYLQSMGYHIYAIRKGWQKVPLFAPADTLPVSTWEEPNYLATKLGKVELDKKCWKGNTTIKGIPASVKGKFG
jgi:hypothetical protein